MELFHLLVYVHT